jgi:hypothetical protein
LPNLAVHPAAFMQNPLSDGIPDLFDQFRHCLFRLRIVTAMKIAAGLQRQSSISLRCQMRVVDRVEAFNDTCSLE